MRRALQVLLLLSSTFLSTAVAAETREPYRQMLDWDSFPRITRDRCIQVSSSDPTGGNEDFDHFVRRNPDGSRVLADLEGIGCVTRIWLTAARDTLEPASIRVFFDGAELPAVDLPVLTFFGGDDPPFVRPLVGGERESSGGYHCYVPLPFSESCRIEAADLGEGRFYYNINATLYPPGDTVETFALPLSPHRAELARRIAEQWNEAGRDPRRDPSNGRVLRKSLTVPPGQTGTLFDLTGPGRVLSLKIRSPRFTPGILRGCFLRISWEGKESPAVDAPLSEYFGVSGAGREFRSLAIGRVGNELYSYFPMPFEKHALIGIRNAGDERAELDVELTVGPSPPNSAREGLFYAVSNKEDLTNSPENYELLDLAGEGHYVGTVLSVRGGSKDFYPYLEGDEMFFVDGESTPSIQGTGTEDYFNGGWYYRFGEFSGPLHGLPYKGSEFGETTQYRIHLLDRVPFSNGIRATIEHGAENTVRAGYRSVAFAYLVPGERRGKPAAAPTPTPVPGDNLLINPGAEAGMAGWTGGGEPAYAPQIDPGTHTPDPANHSGDHRFGLSVGWATADCYQYQTIPVTPGSTYEAGLWLTRRNGTDEVLEMSWVDGDWPGEENTLYRSEGREISKWTELSGATFVPSKNRATIVIRYRHPVPSDICSIHVDDISVREVANPLPLPVSGRGPGG